MHVAKGGWSTEQVAGVKLVAQVAGSPLPTALFLIPEEAQEAMGFRPTSPLPPAAVGVSVNGEAERPPGTLLPAPGALATAVRAESSWSGGCEGLTSAP